MTAGPTTALMRKAYARWAPIYDVVYDKLTEPAARAAVDAALALRTAVCSRRASGPAWRSAITRPTRRSTGSTSPRTCCAGRRMKVDKRGLRPREEPAGDGRHPARLPGRNVRCRDGAIPDHPGAEPGGGADRIRPRAAAGRGDHPRQPFRPAERRRRQGWRKSSRPLVGAIGWSSDFKASRIEAWARSTGKMEIVELKSLFPAGFFKLMRVRKKADGGSSFLTPRRHLPYIATSDAGARAELLRPGAE